MKSLKDYIIYESTEHGDSTTSKIIKLNFSNIENAKGMIEELSNKCQSKNVNCICSDEIITLTITREQCDNGAINDIYKLLYNYITNVRKNIKNASDESYAQKTRKLLNKIEEINKFINISKEETDNVEDNKKEIENNKLDNKDKEDE